MTLPAPPLTPSAHSVVALRIGDDLVGCIADVLAQARRDAGLSQRELAVLAGVTHGMINTYEAGRRHPSVTTLTRLLHATGATVHLDINRPAMRHLARHDVIVQPSAIPTQGEPTS